MSELSGSHLQLLLLVAHGDVLQLSLQLCLGLEQVVGQGVLQVVLLGLQAGTLPQALAQLLLDRLNVLRQLLNLDRNDVGGNGKGGVHLVEFSCLRT